MGILEIRVRTYLTFRMAVCRANPLAGSLSLSLAKVTVLSPYEFWEACWLYEGMLFDDL